jgi:hypothetical protein
MPRALVDVEDSAERTKETNFQFVLSVPILRTCTHENGAEEVLFSLDLIVRLLTIFFSLGREGFPRFHSEI